MDRFCKDCRYCLHEANDTTYKFAKCEHPNLSTTNPVTGEKELMYCFVLRQILSSTCGPEGKRFEPREAV